MLALVLAAALAVAPSTVTPYTAAYGAHALQTMDVYVVNPGGPTAVMIHGGSFARGDKRSSTLLFKHVRDLLLAKGLNVAMPNYRLAADTLSVPPQHPYDDRYPAAHEDVVAAMAYLRDNAAEIGIRWPVAVIGESAGGNLATYVARHAELGVVALVSVAGYPNLMLEAPDEVESIGEHYIGCSRSACPDKWLGASPSLQPGRQLPTLIWHGTSDPVVSLDQSFSFAQEVNVPATTQLVVINGAGHTGLAGFADRERDTEIVDFLTKYLVPRMSPREGDRRARRPR